MNWKQALKQSDLNFIEAQRRNSHKAFLDRKTSLELNSEALESIHSYIDRQFDRKVEELYEENPNS